MYSRGWEWDGISIFSTKHKSHEDDDNNNSRFKPIAKRMNNRQKDSECCDVNIDSSLAETVTDLLRNGADEERYVEWVKDEINSRPANYEWVTCGQSK